MQSDTQTATAGYFRLSWVADGNGDINSPIYQLQESNLRDNSNSRVVYQGPDLARVVSGKPDGDYYYRIRMLDGDQPVGDWSESIRVTVDHHSLVRALSFFIAGAIVFFSLLVFILTQNRKN